MPSQFFGLMIGYSGLTAAQASQNITANNIANINTEGYSRQELKQEAASALRTYTHYGMAGAGVDAKSVDQIRDAYIDLKYRANAASLGEYARKNSYMGEIENYFTDTTVVPGFNSVYVENFYNALSKLEDDPGSTTTRTAFIGQAQSVTEYFNTMAADLEKTQDNINQEVKDVVDRINSIASQIASLNKQINVIEVRGTIANELRDQREVLLDELSTLVDVETREVDVYNYADPDNPTGAKVFQVMIGGASVLVDGYDYDTLECRARDEKVNQSDIDGLYDIYWKRNGGKFYPMAATLSGQLKGLLQLRDGNNKEFFDGKLAAGKPAGTTSTSIDVNVVKGNLTDMTKCTLPDSGTINISGFDYVYSSWSYKENPDGSGTYTFDGLKYRDSNNEMQDGLLDAVSKDMTVRVGQSIDYMGVPYYQAQLNEFVRSFAGVFNKIESRGYDLNGDEMGDRCFFQMVDFEGTQHDLMQTDDSRIDNTNYIIRNASQTNGTYTYNALTAKNFVISSDILADSTKMATTYNKESDSSVDGADLVKDLSSIKTDKGKVAFRGCSSAEFLQCILSDVALSKQSANTFEKNFTIIGQAITNQRLSVSGVDTDEEALNLVKFQHAYELSAKVIQTMTEMYDRLILNTGV
ncbi:MAG: flagellar hook-associated protein FlgK [Lachnospiraceae bacterium]|nr:flagellar hook-associated protein FlgK [Lachnospiraceae bacterium]MBR1524164.1 flagellar hook-associated protein FlgK [Lachnospiraceae bacterium]